MKMIDNKIFKEECKLLLDYLKKRNIKSHLEIRLLLQTLINYIDQQELNFALRDQVIHK